MTIKNLTLLTLTASLLSGQGQALGKLWSHLKPTSFNKGDLVDIHVGQLWSLVRGTTPFDFYSLNWCDSSKGHTYDETLLQEGITYEDTVNDYVHESPYSYKVGQKMDSAEVVCRKKLKKSEVNQFKDMIWKRFRYQLFVDDLPNATMETNEETGKFEANYKQGNLLGSFSKDSSGSNYILYNHLSITVKTHHVTAGDELRIVGFEVEPKSIAYGASLDIATLDE